MALSFLVHGDCVQRAWYAWAAVAGQPIAVVECFDDDIFATIAAFLRGFQV